MALAAAPGMKTQQPSPRPAPGDEAPPGTPGTGEDICPRCNGSGRKDGKPCTHCAGTGKIIRGIGGA